MLLRNRLFLVLVALLAGALLLTAQNSSQQPQQGQVQGGMIEPLPDGQQPANADKGPVPPPVKAGTPQPSAQGQQGQDNGGLLEPLPDNQQPGNADKGPAPPPVNAPNQPGNTVQVPAPQAPSREDNGVFVFRKEVEEVVLHATVVDQHNRLVTDLKRNDFTVFEDGKPQTITSFRREDVPVALGIVIDNSGSMRDKRAAVNAAAINLVKASNPNDQVFVVNFNDEYWLDQDFTGSIPELETALNRIEARGGTALYDAIVASAEHLKKNKLLEKKVLLVVTDGEDNASRESLEQAIRRLQANNGPTVYTIGLLGRDSHQKRARRALQEIAEQTGGIAFFPKDLSEVNSITSSIAHDIRNQYTIGYKPNRPQSEGGYRTVRVEAHAQGYGKLQVRTRSGYYAGSERAAR